MEVGMLYPKVLKPDDGGVEVPLNTECGASGTPDDPRPAHSVHPGWQHTTIADGCR